jgi:hypothetical protein
MTAVVTDIVESGGDLESGSDLESFRIKVKRYEPDYYL